MTLVLTFMSRDHAVLVADTRLCVPNEQTGQLTPLSEDATKFEFARGLMFCFCGVASFTRIPTAEWLRKRFDRAVAGFEAGLAALAEELDARFQRQDFNGHTLTVTIVGWVLDDSDRLTPIVATVTNQHPHTFQKLESFAHEWTVLEHDGGWIATGQITPEHHAQLQQELQVKLQQPVTPDVVANAFLATLRAEAAENVGVGAIARVASLPLQALEHAVQHEDDHIVVWRALEPVLIDGQPTVLNLAPDQLTVEWVTVDRADFSQAKIID